MFRQEATFFKRFCQLAWCLCLLSSGSFTPVLAGSPPSSGVVVLNDGRIFKGAIQEVPGGYRVTSAHNSSILPFSEIHLTAPSMLAAYEAFRDNQTMPTADSRLRLAEWCITNQLYPQAEIEIQAALKLEPLRSDARLLLERVDAILHPESTGTKPQPASRKAALSASVFMTPPNRSVSGLTREMQLEYTTRVQPLLMNKCANGGCHGPRADNKLRLINTHLNSHGLRSASEKNIEAIYAMIDFERPEQSPLLRKPNERTPAHRSLFSGPRQRPQYQIIENWVRQIVREHNPDAPRRRVAEKGPNRTLLIQSSQLISESQQPETSVQQTSLQHPSQTPATFPAIGQGRPIPMRTPQTQETPANQQTNAAADQEFINDIRQSQRGDAFDPNEFNRMMHSTPAPEPASPTP